MKGKNIFTKQEFEELKSLIRQRLNADKSNQKQIRNKMRAIGFFGRDDFGIVDCHISDLESLVRSGIIKVIGNKVSGNMTQKSINNNVVQQTIKDKDTLNPTDHTQNKDLKTAFAVQQSLAWSTPKLCACRTQSSFCKSWASA